MVLHYFIDGYNVLHSHPILEKLAHENLETARLALIDEVSEFCSVTKSHITMIFDGQGRQVERTRPIKGLDDFEVIFSPRTMTADSIIERTLYKTEDRANAIVVTKDSSIGDLCRGLGAMVIRPSMFLSEMENASAQMSPALGAKPGPQTLGRLEDRLNQGATSRLDDLKKALRERKKKS